jgi:hypothetical protein
MRANSPQPRLQIAGAVLLLLGLIVEVFTLFGKGPIAFLVFTGLCATLIVAGILIYLRGLFSSAQPPQHDSQLRRSD